MTSAEYANLVNQHALILERVEKLLQRIEGHLDEHGRLLTKLCESGRVAEARAVEREAYGSADSESAPRFCICGSPLDENGRCVSIPPDPKAVVEASKQPGQQKSSLTSKDDCGAAPEAAPRLLECKCGRALVEREFRDPNTPGLVIAMVCPECGLRFHKCICSEYTIEQARRTR